MSVRSVLSRASLIGAPLLVGCDFPFSADKYPPMDVMLAFSESSACLDELVNACGSKAEDCSNVPGCEAFAKCVREEKNPGATASCQGRENATIEAQLAYEELQSCWANRGNLEQCAVGEEWSCVGRYRAPTVRPRAQLRLVQRVTELNSLPLARGATVAICGQSPECTDPIVTESTGADGSVAVDIPISEGRAGSEWNGVRVLTGADIARSQIRLNIPVWGDWIETTRVATATLVESYRAMNDAPTSTVIFIQALDCASAPAPGVRFEVSQGRVTYVDGLGNIVEGDTTSTGSAAIWGFEPEEPVEIRAVRSADDLVTADFVARVPRDEVLYLKLFPEPSGE